MATYFSAVPLKARLPTGSILHIKVLVFYIRRVTLASPRGFEPRAGHFVPSGWPPSRTTFQRPETCRFQIVT
jgi:hypothetical protein